MRAPYTVPDQIGTVMRTSIVEVGGMLSALSAQGVEKQLMKLPGIDKSDVNYVSGSATVTHDEPVVDLQRIQTKVQECGYHCSGEVLPKHECQAGTNQ
jgi:Cu2+-exporting ATPase